MERWVCLATVCLLVCLALETATVSAGNEAGKDGSHNIRTRASSGYSYTPHRRGSPRISLRSPVIRRSRPVRLIPKSRNKNYRFTTSPRRQWRYTPAGFNMTGARGLYSPSTRVRIPVNSVSSRHLRGRTKNKEWDYTPLHGPSHWPSMYPACSGPRQSPINIQTRHVSYRGFKGTTRVNFILKTTSYSVSFDGYTVKLFPRGRVYVQGVGLPDQTYTVANIHFHWSSQHRRGSEHAVDGVLFPLEMHILCYLSKYNTLDTAKKRKNGLAVLAVIYDIGKANNGLWPVMGATNVINSKDDAVPIRGLDLRPLLPPRLDHFFRYHGSMTTPPCTENVIWTVFEHVQTLSSEQFRVFQGLRSGRLSGPGRVRDNSRPVQVAYSRTVISTNPVFSHSPSTSN